MRHKLLPIMILSSALLLTGCKSFSTSSLSQGGSDTNTESSTSEQGGNEQPIEVNSYVDQPTNATSYTIMVYLCGSNLESYDSQYEEYGSMATNNLLEMLSVQLPSNINLIVETGGANSWNNEKLGYTINANKLTRWHISNKKLVKDTELTYASMGSSSTFQSFIEWGLTSYPADKTGVIMWDHGGALEGCCQDEKKNDILTPVEMNTALKNAFKSKNRTEKLEWIGYDCCLMSVADIAYYNSSYFNYMVTSQETEPGDGWDYDTWLTNFKNNIAASPKTLFKSVVDSYVQKCEDGYVAYSNELYEYAEHLGNGTDSEGNTAADYREYADYYANYNDATLAMLYLGNMDAFKTAWEKVATDLSKVITSSSQWTSFQNNVLNKCVRFGGQEYWGSMMYSYDVFDAQDFIDNMKKKYSSISMTDLQKVLDATIVYNKFGKTYTQNSQDPCGLCVYVASESSASSSTAFPTWKSLSNKYYSSWGY